MWYKHIEVWAYRETKTLWAKWANWSVRWVVTPTPSGIVDSNPTWPINSFIKILVVARLDTRNEVQIPGN